MPKEIYNEGRVVGESAYEIYVRQHLAQYPDTPPASEKDWLSATIASGSSMLLKVPITTDLVEDWTNGYLEIQLPADCTLCAANTIVASFFDGEAHFSNGSRWADRITSYGPLISNTSTSSPDTGEASSTAVIPQDGTAEIPQTTLTKLASYMNIIDGVVIHPGYWKEAGVKPPEKDFLPNLADEHPRIRLKYHGKVDAEPLVLLTGFTISSVVAGTVGTTGSVGTDHPENGDFLGPVDFPWASKIVFSIPNEYVHYMLKSKYDRNLNEPTLTEPSTAGTDRRRVIKSTAIIDMNGTNPGKYYDEYDTYRSKLTNNSTNPRIAYTTNQVNHILGASILTVYQRTEKYPPALYGTYATSESNTYLNPLDVVAPGTIKMFYNSAAEDLAEYEENFPGTWAMNRKPDGRLQVLVGQALVDVAPTITQSWVSLHTTEEDNTDQVTFEAPDTTGSTAGYTGDNRPTGVQVVVEPTNATAKRYMYFAIDSKRDGTGTSQSVIYRNPSAVSNNAPLLLSNSNSRDDLTWAALLAAWQVNKGINILGTNLKINKYSLNKPVSEQSAQSGHNWNWDGTDLYDSESGAAYLQFGDSDVGGGTRLYGLKGSSSQDPRYDSQYPYGKGGFPDPANLPLNAVATGMGWHAMYKVVNYNNAHRWAPLYGGEFDSGTVDPQGGSVQKEFAAGLIIFGRCLTNPSFQAEMDPSSMAEGELTSTWFPKSGDPDYYSNSTSESPTILYIDTWGQPFIIHRGNPNYSIRVWLKCTVDASTGTHTLRTWSLVLRNNEGNNYAQYIMIGQLHHGL